jgi:hypothetical protein
LSQTGGQGFSTEAISMVEHTWQVPRQVFDPNDAVACGFHGSFLIALRSDRRRSASRPSAMPVPNDTQGALLAQDARTSRNWGSSVFPLGRARGSGLNGRRSVVFSWRGVPQYLYLGGSYPGAGMQRTMRGQVAARYAIGPKTCSR